MTKTITQQKTNEELIIKGNEIINSLENFNLAEKWKVIDSLHSSLLDIIKTEGILVELKPGLQND